jgi:hypothetical protein
VANTQITGNIAATIATNLAGGSNGTIPYQSAANTTQMLAVGTAGQVLASTITGTDWINLPAASTGSVVGTGSATLVAYWTNTNTIPGSAGFSYDGTVLRVPALIETSALKFKENIDPLTGSLAQINEMQGVYFNRIGEPKREIGFIADEIAKISPELVDYDDQGEVYGLYYPRITALLVESVKELSQRIQNQEIFIQELKSQVEVLKNK